MNKDTLCSMAEKYQAKVNCKISSSHGGEYDVQSCFLGCTAV
jgi:hypothetical protein